MKLITRQLPDNHNLFFYGDKHEGSVLSTQKGWNELLKLIHSEYDGCSNNWAVDMGDMVEAIMVDDKRFSHEKLTEPLPLEQANKAVEQRETIKDKLLCILFGNHEHTLWRFGNITEDVCRRLGVTYGTWTAKIIIRDTKGKLMYKNYVTHGAKSIKSTADDPKRRKTNMELILKRHLKFKAGDCAVMVKGHTHKLLVCSPEKELYLVDNGKHIKQAYTGWGQTESYIHPDARWYGNSGSFMRLHGKDMSGYAEMFELDPVELGWLVLKVRDKKIIALEPYYLDI